MLASEADAAQARWLSELAPGQSSPFAVEVTSSLSLVDITRCELFVEGTPM
jgi:hypothetical protein